MLIEIYIEALLVDEELADLDWAAWEIEDLAVCVAWLWIVVSGTQKLRPPGPPQIGIGSSTFFAVVRNRWA